MRITMTNFRRHTNSTYDFPDKGMNLIFGKGGSGKSTILLAIVYGFFGKMPTSVKKYTHGKKTCEVVIEYKDLKITRTKPQIVVVEVLSPEGGETSTYEGSEAQSIIEERLKLSYSEFIAGAFISVRNQNSVLSMTATEQLAFVESLTNATQIAEERRESVKLLIKQYSTEAARIQAELSVVEKQRTEMSDALDSTFPSENTICVPDSPEELKALRSEIVEMTLKSKKLGNEINVKNKTLIAERKIKDTFKKAQSRHDALVVEIDQLRRMIAEIILPSQDKITEIETEIGNYRATLDYYNGYVEYIKSVSDLVDVSSTLEAETSARLAELEVVVVDEDTIESYRLSAESAKEYAIAYEIAKKELDEITRKKMDAKNIIADTFRNIRNDPELGRLTAQIVSPKQMVEFLRSAVVQKRETNRKYIISTLPRHECPNCGVGVVIYEDGIHQPEPPPKTKTWAARITKITDGIELLEEYAQKISAASADFNRKLPELDTEPEDYNALYNEYFSAKKNLDEYNTLLEKEEPIMVKKMRERLAKLEKTYADEPEITESTDRETRLYIKQLSDELQHRISELESYNSTYEDYKRLEHSIKIKEKNVEALNNTPYDEFILVELETAISKLTTEIIAINTSINEKKLAVDMFSDYETYTQLKGQLDAVDEKIALLKEEEIQTVAKLEGNHGLEEAIKEAKILALEKTVNSINEHAKPYLNQFFDSDISVRLVCAKDRGNQGYKLQFNTVIEYQGDRYDNVDELSDSELQRCNMAFLLAVNDRIGADLFILDESMNCADQEMHVKVMSTIRDMCRDKLILVVSHEIVRGGVYDHIITVDHNTATGEYENEDLQIAPPADGPAEVVGDTEVVEGEEVDDT